MLTWKRISLVTFGTVLTILQTGEAARAIVAFNKTELRNQRVDFTSGDYTGVVSLNTLLPRERFNCSGSLLADGLHILTAAHCISDSNRVDPAILDFAPVATFNLPTGRVDVPLVDAYVPRRWNGDNDQDIAVLTLASLAPVEAERYDIYRGRDEVGQVLTTVGYGNIGVGATGERQGTAKATVAYFGQNQYELAGAKLVNPTTGERFRYSRHELIYDFDSGEAENDLFGQLLGIHALGLGNLESSSASGDSGAPSFIGNQIAGIVAFGEEFGSPPDIDNEYDVSFGELSGDTRVSSFAKFVDNAVAGRIPSSVGSTRVLASSSRRRNKSANDNISSAPNSRQLPEPSSGLGTFAFVMLGGYTLLKRSRRR